MKIHNALTDEATLLEIARRIRRTRLDLGLTQAELAEKAGVVRPTIERFEANGVANLSTLVRILRSLNILENLDLLLPEMAVRPVESLKSRSGERKRASRRGKPMPTSQSWTWGDQR